LSLAVVLLFVLFELDRDEVVIGGNRDSNGCLISAGYSWNNTEQECVKDYILKDIPCN